LLLLVAVLLAAGLVLGVGPPLVAHDVTFTVNRAADAVDAAPGNGGCAMAWRSCTLWTATQEAHAPAGADIFNLPASLSYTQTIAGTGENTTATCDMGLTDNLTLNGAGADSTLTVTVSVSPAPLLPVGGPKEV